MMTWPICCWRLWTSERKDCLGKGTRYDGGNDRIKGLVGLRGVQFVEQKCTLQGSNMPHPWTISYNPTTLESDFSVLLMEVSQPLSLHICLVRSDRLRGCCCMRVGDGQHRTLATMDSRCYGMHSFPWFRDGGRRWDLRSRILA